MSNGHILSMPRIDSGEVSVVVIDDEVQASIDGRTVAGYLIEGGACVIASEQRNLDRVAAECRRLAGVYVRFADALDGAGAGGVA